MKSNWARFLVLAVIGFTAGAGFALFQARAHLGVKAPAATVLKTVSAAPESAASRPAPMAGVAVGGAFSLTDHTGAAVTEKSWPGKHKLVFFGFTHCPDTCPATLQKISAVMEHFDPAGEKIVPLFITVDPARDTKEVMAQYLGNYNPHIVGLTGTEAQVKAAVDAYKVYAAKVPAAAAPPPEMDHHDHGMDHHDMDYMVDHSAYIYLMSPDDRLQEAFSVEETAENMITKITADSVK